MEVSLIPTWVGALMIWAGGVGLVVAFASMAYLARPGRRRR